MAHPATTPSHSPTGLALPDPPAIDLEAPLRTQTATFALG